MAIERKFLYIDVNNKNMINYVVQIGEFRKVLLWKGRDGRGSQGMVWDGRESEGRKGIKGRKSERNGWEWIGGEGRKSEGKGGRKGIGEDGKGIGEDGKGIGEDGKGMGSKGRGGNEIEGKVRRREWYGMILFPIFQKEFSENFGNRFPR